MLPKKQRLTKKEFDTYFQSGRRFHHELFTLVYTPHEEFHGAVVVGKKVSKKAVARNKIRRRVYSALYARKKEANLTGIYIILTKKPIIDAQFSDIRSVLGDMVGRIDHSR